MRPNFDVDEGEVSAVFATDQIQIIQKEGDGCRVMIGGQWFGFMSVGYERMREIAGLTKS